MATTTMATSHAGFVDCGHKRIIHRRREIVNVPIRNGGINRNILRTSTRRNRPVIEATNNEASSIEEFSGQNDNDQIDDDPTMFRIESLVMNAECVSNDDDNRNRSTGSLEKLDEWTRESVEEIMKNIKQAPFIMFVYSSSSDESAHSSDCFRLKTEPVEAQSWKLLSQRWDEDGSSAPDGIILVEELMVDGEEKENCRQSESQGCRKRIWGLLVQGRGVGCSACYILNTCRVVSLVGASTHFFLVRANCFGDSIQVQLMKSWLNR